MKWLKKLLSFEEDPRVEYVHESKNPFSLLSDDEVMEMAVFPDRYFIGKDSKFHRIADEIV